MYRQRRIVSPLSLSFGRLMQLVHSKYGFFLLIHFEGKLSEPNPPSHGTYSIALVSLKSPSCWVLFHLRRSFGLYGEDRGCVQELMRNLKIWSSVWFLHLVSEDFPALPLPAALHYPPDPDCFCRVLFKGVVYVSAGEVEEGNMQCRFHSNPSAFGTYNPALLPCWGDENGNLFWVKFLK